MKRGMIIGVLALVSCQKSEVVAPVSPFTGNETKYGLTPASVYPIDGTITFKERKDGATSVIIQLSGTNGDVKFPVHLHAGDLASNGSTTIALLSPVNGKTGVSETIVSYLGDETRVTYTDLLKLSAYVNVHLSNTGAASNEIIAAGNIGSAVSKNSNGSRIGLCTGK